MARRIEIELTSARPDGTWTWRAAGALQPRGTLDGRVLHEGAKAGDVVRAEADFELDGITILAVIPPKEKHRAEATRLELIAPAGSDAGGVTYSEGAADAADGRRPRGSAGRRPQEGGARRPPERRGSERGPSDRGPSDRGPTDRSRPERRTPDRRPSMDRRSGDRRPPATLGSDGAAPNGESPTGLPQEAAHDGAGEAVSAARESAPRSSSPPSDRSRRRPATEPRRGADAASTRDGPSPRDRDHDRGRRLNPAHVHRDAVVASLPPEEQPIAEQVLRGGIPAVRTAIHLEREKAEAEGRPAPQADSLIAIAESLLPRLKAAEWRDRAEAVVKVSDDVALRDLRSVVAGADVARDEESRALLADLRQALERRQVTLTEEWNKEMQTHLDEGRLVRALRLAARPPVSDARIEPSVSADLTTLSGAAMSSDTPPQRWLSLLEAVAASPVRRSVKPAGLPEGADAELRRVAHQQAGRVPALAPLLGLAIPPPPGPLRRAASAGAPVASAPPPAG